MKIDFGQIAGLVYIVRVAWGAWKNRGRGDSTMMISKIRPWWVRQDKFLKAILVPSLLFSIFSLYLFYAQPNWRFITFPSIKVYEPFDDIHKTYKEKLGQAKGEPETVGKANYIMCEHAAVLWIDKLHYHFILHGDSWQKEPASQTPYDLQTYLLPDRNRQIPECKTRGLKPPEGGLFLLWKDNPDKWRNLVGCVSWGCQNPFPIHYQRFEHGWIFGTIPVNKSDDKNGMVYALVESAKSESMGKLYVEDAKEPLSKCTPW